MKKHLLLLFVFFFLSIYAIYAKTYYVATNGNDATGTGSISLPFATIMKAHQFVVAGDTVLVRGGTYTMTESQINLKSSIWAYMNYLDKSGTSNTKRIYYWAYPGERPIIDMSNVKPAGYRNIVFFVKGSWLYIKGLEVIGTQVTISTHTQSECFHNEGSNNIFEQLSMHDGMAIGFYLTRGSNNLVLNCDAYRNWDYFSETGKGGNTDGFGCHPAKGGTGNVIRGCRAWFNSDDGYDCINSDESVIFENCWAFFNGYNSSFASEGDGNGFKAGGYGKAPIVSELPNPIPANIVRFCMAYRNKSNGFYANHHVQTGSYWYNNTAYRNAKNYNMLSQRITKSLITGADTTLDCQGFNHILKNNISYKYSSSGDTLNIGTSVNTYNSFSPDISVTVDAKDFVSTDESLLVSDRQVDGSLPNVEFLKLKAGSDLIDKGMDLGFPFLGIAPDLGAFEYQPDVITAVSEFSESHLPLVYPNPVTDSAAYLAISVDAPQKVSMSLFSLSGELLRSNFLGTYQSGEVKLPFQDLSPGTYLLNVFLGNKKEVMKIIIK